MNNPFLLLLIIIFTGCNSGSGSVDGESDNKQSSQFLAKNIILRSAYASQDIGANVDTDTQILAENVVYETESSVLNATNVQEAIDNLSENLETSIVGTWSGYVICPSSKLDCRIERMDALGFNSLGNSELIEKLDNSSVTFTAQSQTEDGTFTFINKNFFCTLCETNDSDTCKLSGTYRIDDNILYIKLAYMDGYDRGVGRFENVQVVGDKLKMLFNYGCTAYYERQ